MSEKKSMFTITVLKNAIDVYFDTFFVFYFFSVANYEVLPLAKYYLTFYLLQGVAFFVIRNAMKRNIKAPYFRIGISLQALFIALILILKEHIIDYVYLVASVKGIAGGFFHYPRNILNSEKVGNEERQKYEGFTNAVNRIVSIVIPLILGVLLTFFTYIEIGKVVFLMFVLMFIVSFWIKDGEFRCQKFEFKKFYKLLKENKDVRLCLTIPFLSGFSYSSGVMGTIITLLKITSFKTNLALGYVDSLCALLGLLVTILYTVKIKKKSFEVLSYISGISLCIALISLAVHPSLIVLVTYLLIRNSLVKLLELIDDHVTTNFSNFPVLKEHKAEYYGLRDMIFSASRSVGQVVLLVTCLSFGTGSINYILILPALAILVECIIVGKLSKKC